MKLAMSLYRGKLPATTFTALVDTDIGQDLAGRSIVLKDIQGTRDQASHVMLGLDGMRAHSPTNGVGCSLRRFLIGPNHRNRVKDTASNDYTRPAFFMVLEPVQANTLLAVFRDVRSSRYAFRYYCITAKRCILVYTTKDKLREDVLSKVGTPLPSEFDPWFERKQPGRRKVVVDDAHEETPVDESTIDPPVQASSSISVQDDKGEEQMAFTKELQVPAGSKPIDMEVNIPIPYTGLSITIKVKTH